MELGKQELPIGRFARLSGLTVKALRHYDEIGLLPPARVDDWTGYRYYAVSQARRAEAIRRLRSLDVPLEEIRELVQADEARLRERLAVHRARIQGRAVDVRRILSELDLLIDRREQLVPETMLELEIKDVPAQRVAVIAQTAHADEMHAVVPRLIDEVGAQLDELGVRPVGPPWCVCPFPDEEGMIATEIGWPVDDDVATRPPVAVKTYPATRAAVHRHVGPYEDLSRSYRLMAEAMEARRLTPTDEPRELYETDPGEVTDPKDYVTLIVWPVAA